MRCPTCGEILADATSRCPTCGAAVSAARGSVTAVRRCPRCNYAGQGIAYFSRPGHLALLVGVSLFTYGLGGLVYWLRRRRHRVCPSCGFGWEHAIGVLTEGPTPREALVPPAEKEEELPSGGFKRRAVGALLILLAGFLLVFGIVELEAALIAAGSAVGVAGTGAFYWGWSATQARRQALMGRLQRKVLRFATRSGGTLTVTEVAAELSLSMTAAEKVLIAMDDGFRVRSEITPEGILLYEFPEVKHRARLESGPDST